MEEAQFNKLIDNDEVNIEEIRKVIFLNKKFLFACISSSIIISFLITILIPNRYESTLLMVADEELSLESSMSQYSGLAGFAGMTLPAEASQASIGVEILQSRILFEKFSNKYNILVPLFASKSWNEDTGELKINDKIYDTASKKWTRKISPPFEAMPSGYEAYKLWIEEIFSFSYDDRTGFVKVTIKHHSPYIAQEWASLLIVELNNFMRKDAVDEAELAIEYLENEVNQTQSEELKLLFYKLIQSKTERIMLAYSRDEYIFRLIDPPYVSQEPFSPNRILFLIAGLFFGLTAGVIFLLYIRPPKTKPVSS